MKLEEGKYYKTRGGEKAGPATFVRNSGWALKIGRALLYYNDDGSFTNSRNDFDIISEWTEEPEKSNQGPIRTVTKKELVPGVYGRVLVIEREDGKGIYSIDFMPTLDPSELREAANIFIQIADYLEGVE